jgi:hypothetical protein
MLAERPRAVDNVNDAAAFGERTEQLEFLDKLRLAAMCLGEVARQIPRMGGAVASTRSFAEGVEIRGYR